MNTHLERSHGTSPAAQQTPAPESSTVRHHASIQRPNTLVESGPVAARRLLVPRGCHSVGEQIADLGSHPLTW